MQILESFVKMKDFVWYIAYENLYSKNRLFMPVFTVMGLENSALAVAGFSVFPFRYIQLLLD